MKFKVNLSENLNYENIQLPKLVPFFIHGKEAGNCLIDPDGNGEITIETSIKEQILHLGIGGYITSMKGNVITSFELKEISII